MHYLSQHLSNSSKVNKVMYWYMNDNYNNTHILTSTFQTKLENELLQPKLKYMNFIAK